MIKDLPKKLCSLRKQYRLSQKAVAKRLGVSPSLISAYETGERTPTVENLLALSYLYHCSIDSLLGRQQSTALDLNGLTDEQISALAALINAMRKS